MEKPARTKEVILQEYAQKCAWVGERIYRMEKMNAEIKEINIQIDKLSLEMAELEKAPTNNQPQEVTQ